MGFVSGVEPQQFDIVIYRHAQWQRILLLADPVTNAPIDVTGWTGLMQVRADPGSSLDNVNTTLAPYVAPGTTTPSGFTATIPQTTTGGLTYSRYDHWIKVYDTAGVQQWAAFGAVRVVQGPPP